MNDSPSQNTTTQSQFNDGAIRIDLYQTITNRILDMLDKGTVPWRHPILTSGSGGSSGGGGGLPRNLVSNKAYRGINVFLLAMTSWAQGYDSSYWLTYRQAREKGGQVRRGERATPVVFWKQHVLKDRDSGEDKTVPVFRHYNVFNALQCDGIEVPDQAVGEERVGEFEPIVEAE